MLKVLIVDDDPAVLATFARMLRLTGYDVHTALDAETALRDMEAFHPDAVLLDLRMPLMDGIAFLRQLRARKGQCRIPVAVLTADYLLDDATVHELKHLDSEVYFKPLWLDDLIAITRQLIHKAT
jgi:two-component system response regulator MprA